MNNPENKGITQELIAQGTILGIFVVLFWVIEIVDQVVFRHRLDQFGVTPRTFQGLIGIVFAPFLHGGWQHLIANTIPFIILGWFTMIQETSDFFLVTFMTTLVGGLGIWLFGASNTTHIGASILIFGYLGFMLLRGYFQRNFISVFLSVLVALLYGRLVFGVLPSGAGISWEGHLFGFLGGILTARMIGKRNL
jgi:membrane associated rhomboid family serine protease